MSNLFPDKPDYVGVPLITAEVDLRVPIVGAAIAGTVLALCPAVHEEHEHGPHQEYGIDLNLTRASAMSSTSASTGSQPFFGMADDDSMAAIMRHHARRQAAHMASSS